MLGITNIHHHLKSIVCFLVLVLCIKANAQIDSVIKAQELCKEKQFDRAISILDKVVLHPETKNDEQAWNLRSLVYVNQAKILQINKKNNEKEIEVAISSALESMRLDSKKTLLKENEELIDNCAKKYKILYSELIKNIAINNYEKVNYFRDKYKQTRLIAVPNYDFKNEDIDYYNFVGGHFAESYSKDSLYKDVNSSKNFEIAKFSLLKVLSIDPRNEKANEHLGVLYFNQGVGIINNSEYDAPMTELPVIQENARKLFKQSQYYMQIVYDVNPNSEKVLSAFEGIYMALHLEDAAKEMRLKREGLIDKK